MSKDQGKFNIFIHDPFKTEKMGLKGTTQNVAWVTDTMKAFLVFKMTLETSNAESKPLQYKTIVKFDQYNIKTKCVPIFIFKTWSSRLSLWCQGQALLCLIHC